MDGNTVGEMINKIAVFDGSHLSFKVVLGHPCDGVRLNVK